MKYFKVFSIIAILLMTACNSKASNVEVVSPEVFQTKISQDYDAYLLDVRQPEEYEAGHLKGAHLLNWLDSDQFMAKAGELDKSKTIYVYCRSGRRSNEAANYLAGLGYKVVDMDGGILAWEKSGRPIVSGATPEADDPASGSQLHR